MLLERRLRDGIHNGSITVMFRRWRRCQVLAGGRYRTGLDLIEVDPERGCIPQDIIERYQKETQRKVERAAARPGMRPGRTRT